MAKQGQRPERQQSDDPDARLSKAFHECFSTPAGAMVLDHLRGAFISSVMGPDATDQQLRYREGQRSVVGIIDTRIKEARKA